MAERGEHGGPGLVVEGERGAGVVLMLQATYRWATSPAYRTVRRRWPRHPRPAVHWCPHRRAAAPGRRPGVPGR
ncbi:hypothetical protein HBB16_15605 [Pseudonocardia sp. MCCB 268]|nr:hypothetical protein [Pseudonocardia cytotoxica]